MASLLDTTTSPTGDLALPPPADVAFSFAYDACPECPTAPLCEAGLTRCWSNHAVQTCNSNGTGFCVETCPEGSACVDGACCIPSCEGRACGSDGCFGSCGQCAGSEVCSEGACTSVLCDLTDGDTWVRGGAPVQSFQVLPDGRSLALSSTGELLRFGGDGLVTATVAVAPPNTEYEAGPLLALASGLIVVPWNVLGDDKSSVPGVALVNSADVVTHKAWPGPGHTFVRRVVATGDGLLVAGQRTLSATGASSRLWVVRADTGGDKLWDKEVVAADVETRFVDAASAPDGGVAILALQYPEAGPWAAQVVRVTRDGESAGSTLLSPVEQPAAIATVDGGWLVLGPPHASAVTRLDSTGAILWSKEVPNAQVAGACAVGDGALLAGGQVVITQPADGSDAFAAGMVRTYGWLRRISHAGDLIWERRYGHLLADSALTFVGTAESGHILAAGTLRLRATSGGDAPECGGQ